MHPRYFASDKSSVRAYVRPPLHVSWVERKNSNKSDFFFFRLNFNVCNDVDNRERARARDNKQRRRISLEEEQKNFIAAVSKWGMLAATKKNSEQRQMRHFLHKKCNWEVSRFIRAKQEQRNVQKSVYVVCLFFAQFSLPSPFSATLYTI